MTGARKELSKLHTKHLPEFLQKQLTDDDVKCHIITPRGQSRFGGGTNDITSS